MRKLFAVVALLAMLVALDALKVESVGDAHPLALAAVGLLFLTAFAVAEIGARFGAPRITGFVATGFVLGPFAQNIVDRSIVADVGALSTVALGLIGLMVGLRVEVAGLIERGRLVAYTLLLQVAAVGVFVGGTALALGHASGLPGTTTPWAGWIVAAVVAAAALGTSPAIALATSIEAGAKGPVTSLALELGVVKAVVLLAALAVLMFTTAPLGGATPLGAGIVGHAALALALSVPLGAALGGALVGLLRLTHNVLLAVAASVLVVAELVTDTPLFVLVTFAVAGFVIRRFSAHAQVFQGSLSSFGFPLFILLFTTLGVGLDRSTEWSVWSFAAILCVARTVAYYLSAHLAARLAGERGPARRVAWAAHLPQAEVTATILAVVALAFPSVDTVILRVGLAMLAINMLAGPIAARLAVRAAAETAPDRQAVAAPKQGDLADELARLTSPRLRQAAAEARQRLEQPWSLWVASTLEPGIQRFVDRLRLPEEDNTHVAALVTDRLDRVPPDDSVQRLADLQGVLATQLDHLDRLPGSEAVPLDPEHVSMAAGDSFRARWAKRVRRAAAALGRGPGTRSVPVRLLARTALEPRMIRAAEETWRDWQRFEISGLETLQRAVFGTESLAEVNRDLQALKTDVIDKVEANLASAIEAGMHELVSRLRTAGAPGVSTRAYRYSRVEPGIAAALQRMAEDAQEWSTCRTAAIATLRFLASVEHAQFRLVQDIVNDVAAPLDEAFGVVQRLVAEEQRRVEGLTRDIPVAATDDEAWRRFALRAHAVFPKPALKDLRAAEQRVRRATATSAPMSGLLAFVEDRSDPVRMIPSLHALTIAPRPATVGTVVVDPRELKEVEIAGRLLPTLEEALAEVGDAFTELRETTREAAHAIELACETAQSSRDAGEGVEGLGEAIERASDRLVALQARSCGAWARRRGEVLSNVARMSHRVADAVASIAGGESDDGGDLAARGERLWTRARLRVSSMIARIEGWGAGWLMTETGHAAEELAQLYRLRAGVQRLDAKAIRGLVTEQEQLRAAQLPEDYAALFSLQPLRDPRLFVANRRVLDDVVLAERAWHRTTDAGNGVLVLGDSGWGKSSVLAVARLKLEARRVLVVGREPGDASIVEALSHVLTTEASVEALERALLHQRSAILVDDLQDWFAPTAAGIAALDDFLRLITATQPTTFWIAGMRTEAFEAWDGTVGLGHAFAAVLQLQPITAEDLDAVLTARQRLSGYDVVFPTTLGSRIAERLLGRSARASFVRSLAAASGGNPRAALQLWSAHAREDEAADGRGIVLRPVHSFGWGLPFVRQLDSTVKAALSSLVRFGALSQPALQDAVGTGTEEARQVVRFLLAARLAERDPTGDRISIPVALRDDLVAALAEEGVVAGGES